MNYEEQLIDIIKNDQYIMTVLKVVEQLQLPDAWVAAGLIRNKVWDVLHNVHTPINDIDVIFFDSADLSIKTEKELEQKLGMLMPKQPWSVKNQARMHVKNGMDPYASSFDGVAHFTEIPTAIAAKISNGKIEIMAPYGLEDLFEKVVKPTPYYQDDRELRSIYIERMQQKKWRTIWSALTIEE